MPYGLQGTYTDNNKVLFKYLTETVSPAPSPAEAACLALLEKEDEKRIVSVYVTSVKLFKMLQEGFSYLGLFLRYCSDEYLWIG